MSAQITLESMLDVGVHFGHQARKWNPKMAPYIYGERNGIHILDILQTAICLEEVRQYLRESATRGEHLLLVGTRSQASGLVKAASIQSRYEQNPQQVHYVNHRWLGGMLTNWSTIQGCVNKLRDIENQSKLGLLENLPKKEAASAKKQYNRLRKFLGGVKELNKVPETVLIVGQPTEINAVQECQKLKLRTVTLLDTDCDPSLADLFVPANDDSVAAVELILNQMVRAFQEGQVLGQQR